jgi:hypothetical protein
MATVGTAKSVLVDKINSLTSSATPKDTIFLAKALGEATSLTNFVWKGTWTTGTEYAIDEVVRNGNDSYVCVSAHTAGATFSGDSAKWELMAQGSEVPDQTGNAGKVLKTDGSTLSWGESVPDQAGNAGKALVTDGSTLSWGDTGTIKKVHTLRYGSQVTGSTNSNYDAFTWGNFTPLDPVNNGFIVHISIPTDHNGQDYGSHGLRLVGPSTYDFNLRGVMHIDVGGAYMSVEGQHFYIAPGEIAAGTYSARWRIHEGNSAAEYYCINTSRNNRVGGQTSGELMIIEYKNPA